MKRASVLLAGVLTAAVAAAPLAAAPSVEVGLDPIEVTVGDRVAATIIVRLDEDDGRLPRFPDWSAGWGRASVLATAPAARVDEAGGVVWRQSLELAAFEVGRIELPPVAVVLEGAPPRLEAPNRVATPSGLAFEVRSVLPPEPENVQPAPADPPRALPVPAAFWWTAGASVLVAAALALLLARRARRSAALPAATPLAPLAELERALGTLAGAEPIAAHAALSLALRRFLGRALSLPAAESTTGELAHRLGSRPLERATIQRTVRLLREIDQVKFARRPATAAELAVRVEEARAVALEIERRFAAPAAEAAA